MNNDNRPLISIIVPVYNVEDFLVRCLDSIINQSLENIEIILVDDGSTDSSGAICELYKEKDTRIKLIKKVNAGLGFARNSGLEIAKGKFIGFVDSDDFIEKNMYEEMYKQLQKDNSDTCFCRYYNTFPNGKSIIADEMYSKKIYYEVEIKKLLLGMIGSESNKKSDVDIGMSVWKGLYSKEIIDKYMLLFPSEREYISEDIIFQIKYLLRCKKVSIVQEAYYHYWKNDNSLTQKYKSDRFEMEKKLYFKEVDELSGIYSLAEYEQRLYKSFIGRLRACIKQEVINNPNKENTNTNIKKICTDLLVTSIMENYNFKDEIIGHRLFNYFVRKKNIKMLKLMINIHEKV